MNTLLFLADLILSPRQAVCCFLAVAGVFLAIGWMMGASSESQGEDDL
jgi:hypothetical protein